MRILVISLLISCVSLFRPLLAQPVQYIELINRSLTPHLFYNHILLPADSGNTNLVITFRFDYNFLPFKKLGIEDEIKAPNGEEFYTSIRLSSEVFEGLSKKRSKESYSSIFRNVWQDTVFAKNFNETQQNKLYASGALSTELAPGKYNYVLQLNLMNQSDERSSNRQNVLAPKWSEKKTGEIYLIKSVESQQNEQILALMNMTDNVYYGEDFYALIEIPNYKDSLSYEIKIHKANVSKQDTSLREQIYTYTLSERDIHTSSLPVLTDEKNEPALLLRKGNYSFTYALVTIPNGSFGNATYNMEVYEAGESKSIAKAFFRSYWPDMPASLYSLDISIDMLKFIVNEGQLKELKAGNKQIKEEKFLAFWKKKDPTPDTEFNELMAEYYRRIDYAFKEFGNRQNMAGYESDQGKIYIKYGPPKSKERQFPTTGNVREIWDYGNRKFIFEATSGFGDFVLLRTN